MNGIASGIERDRVAYADLLAGSRQRSVFSQAWWLDAVTGSPDGWCPNILWSSDGTARAAWPLPTRSTSAGQVGVGVPYTPFLGPLLPDGEPGVARVSTDVELLESLADQLSGHAHVEAACMPELDYWTPLSWHGFEQTSRTTWRIAAGQTADAVRANMRRGGRSALKSAERDGLVVGPGTIEELLAACESTFVAQGADDLPDRDALARVAEAALERGHGEILAVRTADGALTSAGLCVFDDRWTWNLANGRIADSRTRGGTMALLWHSLERALERGTGFDFEGSMIKTVEAFFRGFGGEPVAYSVVRRSSPSVGTHCCPPSPHQADTAPMSSVRRPT